MTTRDKFLVFALTVIIVTLGVVAFRATNEPEKHSEPHGLVTGKYWNSAFWRDGVLVDPATYCLEIDYRSSTCVKEPVYYKYEQGMMYP